MKLYTVTYDCNTPTVQRLNIPTNTDYKVGVKIVKNGEVLDIDPEDMTLGATTADAEKLNGYVTFTKSTGAEANYWQGVLAIDADDLKTNFKLIINAYKSQMGDIGGAGGGVTEQWVQDYVSAETSAFVDDTELGTVLEAYPTTSEMNTAISTATSDKVTGTGVGQAPAVRAIAAVYETPWAALSANADANTCYVVLPDPVILTRVKYTAASGYPDWESDIVGQIIGGDGSPTSQIPNVYSASEIVIGSKVTELADYAFYNCGYLSSVTIGNGVSAIGYGAFQDCNGITELTIPGSVTMVSNGAFENCTSLTSVTVENGVTFLGDYSFENCLSLSSFTMTSSVTAIGDDIFKDCTNLMSVTWQGITVAEVQAMDLSNCGFQTGCVIHCTDGDITIT